MHPLNEFFEKVYCINLVERPDKRKNMQTKFDKLGIEVEWFDAVKYDFAPFVVKAINTVRGKQQGGSFNDHQPYEIGAALSHYTVIKKALLEKRKQIFVFEDDVLFDKKFNDKIEKYLDNIPDNANMIMFYSFMYELKEQHKRVNSRWITAFNAWSLMAYGMDAKMMEAYIKFQNNFFTVSDVASFKLQEDPNLNVYSAVPSICIPNSELGSNIRGENMNYKTSPTITNMGVSDENYE